MEAAATIRADDTPAHLLQRCCSADRPDALALEGRDKEMLGAWSERRAGREVIWALLSSGPGTRLSSEIHKLGSQKLNVL